ncbi:unannotated protein [freshwater metagenome]|uniref:Unannotated protein n=1 Tax=freshwater metagenome TaxID=449393 RepID=A0A6J6PHN9_9ZZZZ
MPNQKIADSSRRWFTGIFALFLIRGFVYGTWASQNPAIKELLSLDNTQMGIYAMVFATGSIAGVMIAGRIVGRLGSRNTSLVTYFLFCLGLVALGVTVYDQNALLAFALTALIGLPIGTADFDNNLEATEINRVSGRNRVPSLHAGFSFGLLGGSGLASLLLAQNVSIAVHLALVGIVLIVVSMLSSVLIPRMNGYETKLRKTSSLDTGAIELAHVEVQHESKVTQLTAWRQRRSLMIVFIAFAIIFSEGAASIWMPVALVEEGWSQSAAVFCFTVFAVVATTMRLLGNRIADALGRRRVVNYSGVIAAIGIGLFMLSPIIGLEYLAAVIWSIGNAIGLAMCVAALGDDPRMTSARMSMLWNTVYIANLVIGPAIGILSEFVGLYWAFGLPLVLMLAITFFSKAVEKEKLTADA